MENTTQRRLHLADLAILVAGASLGVWLLRIAHESRSTFSPPGGYWPPLSQRIGLEVSPFILSTAATLLIARFLRPRPEFRELIRQPGVIACLAILADLILVILFRFMHWYLSSLHGNGIINYSIDAYLLTGMYVGEPVAFSWAALALAGAWHPEPSWIDRAGRLLGALAILLWVAVAMSL